MVVFLILVGVVLLWLFMFVAHKNAELRRDNIRLKTGMSLPDIDTNDTVYGPGWEKHLQDRRDREMKPR